MGRDREGSGSCTCSNWGLNQLRPQPCKPKAATVKLAFSPDATCLTAVAAGSLQVPSTLYGSCPTNP